MGLLDSKVAVVTGAGGGLGRAYAQLLAQEGAAVVVNDFLAEAADRVADEIRKAGGRAVGNGADVSTMEGGRHILHAALDTFGAVDVLVNNAGILRDKTFSKMEEADWDAVIGVHLKGAFCVTQPIFNQMKALGGGVIVNTTSTSGIRGKFGQTNYGAAKAALWGFSNSLALEGERYGIRVWTIAPAAATALTDGMSEDYRQTFTPERVAPVILYMASALSEGQSGKTLLAGGGWIGEARMEIHPGFAPSATFDAHELAMAAAEGRVFFPPRAPNFVNAYGPLKQA